MGIVIGIDTSCYTTSVAIVDTEENLIGEHRQLLKVPKGDRGLKQSEAVFQHVQNMKTVFSKVKNFTKRENIVAISASTKPRPIENSYMPVFTVGESQGRVLASMLEVPFWETSHQEGHLLAGMWSSGFNTDENFLAIHLSGGTSEIMHVVSKKGENLFEIELLGGTKDLHAGQFVDRIGVAMNLPFPAGPHLEKMASNAIIQDTYIPSYVKGFDFSFSGAETHALRLLRQGMSAETVARAVENVIAKTIEKAARNAIELTGLKKILFVGGVAANQHLRERLKYRLEHPAVGGKLYFADPSLSADNAVGTALLGVMALQRGIL